MTPSRLQSIKYLLWIYFLSLILDGALRKWFLPSLSTPLLLLRDPVAVLAILWGLPLLRKPKFWQWVQPLMLIAVLSFLLAITVGHGDLAVAIFGTRILVLHFPLIFLYAAVFDRNDVVRFAWAIALLSIPMTILIAYQSNMPDTHLINIAPGGEGTASFPGALGRSRPSGTFAFTNGVTNFYTLAASSLFGLLYTVKLNQLGRLICVLSGIALIVAQPVSMSRALLAGYLMALAALVVALIISRTRIFSLVAGLLSFFIMISIATTIPAFQETSKAFAARWESASAVSGPTIASDAQFGGGAGQFRVRVLGSLLQPFENLDTRPFFGFGTGMGTNVGAQRLSGKVGFTLGEGGWDSLLAEFGYPLGLAYIFWRIALSFWMLRLSITQATTGNRLPLIFLAFSFLITMSGQTGQPTALGFLIVSAGLTLAACNIHYTFSSPSSQP